MTVERFKRRVRRIGRKLGVDKVPIAKNAS